VVERIVRSELVVVDDIGLLPAGAEEAETLYRLVDAAYEKRSLIVTSNLHPARFDTIFPKGLATAAVDRLLHRAHVIVTEGQCTGSPRPSRATVSARSSRLPEVETVD
jgi:DNA replication protein DnaC